MKSKNFILPSCCDTYFFKAPRQKQVQVLWDAEYTLLSAGDVKVERNSKHLVFAWDLPNLG